MILAQEVKIKLKKYEGLNNDDPSIMQISSIPHSKVLAILGQNSQFGNAQNMNQAHDATVSRPNWKGNVTHYKHGDEGHLA